MGGHHPFVTSFHLQGNHGQQWFSRYAPQVAPTTAQPERVRSRSMSSAIWTSQHGAGGAQQDNLFPGDPAERVYLIRRGAVRLSRVYESGEEITVALLRENSSSKVILPTGHRSDRFYHAIAFTRVEMVTAPAASVRAASRPTQPPDCACCRACPADSADRNNDRNLTHRDMSSRLVSLVLCRDFGVLDELGITIDLRLSHQAIAEAIGSTRVTITRLLGDLRQSGLQIDRKKITVLDPIAPAKRFAEPNPGAAADEWLAADPGAVGSGRQPLNPGDRLGSRVGKARLSLFNMRPRRTPS